MSLPDITAAEIEAVNQVLQTPYLSIGPCIAEFEKRFAAFVGARHAIGISSGTAGLHLCVIAAGVSEGDLVITTPFSFVASANVILYERAIPIFVDIDPKTLNIDPSPVAEAIHDLSRGGPPARRWLPRSIRNRKSEIGNLKSILPVHAFGQPADMDPLLDVAREYNLAVIEDACEAIGAEYKGRRIGSTLATCDLRPATCDLRPATCDLRPVTCDLRLATCFAFYPNKQMTTGEGAMIVTDRNDWNDLFRSLRNQGRDVHNAWLSHSRLGYNYRLDEMSAALGLAQLGRIEELLAKRERVARWYNERLKDVEGVQIPYVAPTTTRMSWFVYVIRLFPEIDRHRVMTELEERGIPSRPYFSCIHLQPFYRQRFGYKEGDFPVAESISKSSLALPFYGNLDEEKMDYVCESLREIIKRRPKD
jgi:dTDP-4-amino-4,6-dideoxygalactose transaminase